MAKQQAQQQHYRTAAVGWFAVQVWRPRYQRAGAPAADESQHPVEGQGQQQAMSPSIRASARLNGGMAAARRQLSSINHNVTTSNNKRLQ
ncbi:hypothetical protein OEZ85_003364 [Tetradesmus obliquus]|uniref:DUF4005 domain-containing protein n=1 Tax=Tetradesmus obliquus TaxID=3088 RepID=A0ABY8UBA9_TETOB|nr:hypothetical protein OEZ85_003364 [Tetradesmus obliquus]